ncbi:MAG: hypothetical protein LAO21_05400 [Acidobacteriia bacterium]|nr:hypothetical protein [Terriglobia bacterium]
MSSPPSNSSKLIEFERNKKFLGGGSAVGLEIVFPVADLDVVSALATDSPFPQRTIELGREAIKASAGRDILFGSGNAEVSFNGSASAFAQLGVYFDPDAMLRGLELNDNIEPGMKLENDPDVLYSALRWGYDVKGSASGSIAMGAPGAVTFGVDGGQEGLYAVIRRLEKNTGALTTVGETLNSWMMPSQIGSVDDLTPGTWLIADVEGSIALQLGAQFGYNFNWVQQAQMGGLKGDIGLQLQLGISAALGFEASGQYAVVVSRESADDQDKRLRLRLFKQRKKGWNFAFDAGATVQGGGFLPAKMQGFIQAVFGVHGAQIVRDLRLLKKWTDPKLSPSEGLAGVSADYGLNFLREVTSIDPLKLFEESKKKLLGFLDLWDSLPHGVATLLESLVDADPSHTQDHLIAVREAARKIAGGQQDDAACFIRTLLGDVEFFQSAVGRWLESAAAGAVLKALSGTREFEELQRIARVTGDLLADDVVEKTVLVKLSQFIKSHLDLKLIESVSDRAGFDALDEWLKGRLSGFLSESLDLARLDEIRKTMHLVLDKGQEFFDASLKALTRTYGVQFNAAFQSSTSRTALLDIVFDFGVTGSLDAFRQALSGKFDTLLIERRPGITLNVATLTHQIQRNTHVEINFPFFECSLDHINTALAKVNAVEAEEGRLLLYELDAEDVVTSKNRRNSRLAVGGYLKVGNNQVRVHSTAPLSYSYTFRQAKKGMRRADLLFQLKPYVASYFPDVFASSAGTAGDPFLMWIDALDKVADPEASPGSDNFGNTLISLEVSVPGVVASAWLKASPDKNSPQYRDVSLRLQSKLKHLIPFYYFQNLKNYGNIEPAGVLLVYAAMPAWAPPDDVYWDFQDGEKRKSLVGSQQTSQNLRILLQSVHDLLAETPGMGVTAGFFKPDQAPRLQKDAVEGMNDVLLTGLLAVEASTARGARDAAVALARFLQEAGTRPSDAVATLASFGSKITETFNDRIKSVYGGDAVRPLGSMVFLEAASIFDPTAAQTKAILDLIVVKQQSEFNLPDFLTGTIPPKSEMLVQQRLVSTGW